MLHNQEGTGTNLVPVPSHDMDDLIAGHLEITVPLTGIPEVSGFLGSRRIPSGDFLRR